MQTKIKNFAFNKDGNEKAEVEESKVLQKEKKNEGILKILVNIENVCKAYEKLPWRSTSVNFDVWRCYPQSYRLR